jgi:L-malate glycosyltransferase
MMSGRVARICFATTEYPPHPGGAARSARRLVQGLAARGVDVVVFSAVSPGQVRSALADEDDGVVVHWLPYDHAPALAAIAGEDRIRPFDLFHGFTLHAAWPCLTVAASGDRPVVAGIRGIDGVLFDDVSIDVLQRAHWITSVSADGLARAAAMVDLASRSGVIPNGIDVARPACWQPCPDNAGVVGTVATFRPKKNIPLLIRAYARLPRARRRRLLLVGDAYEGDVVSPRGRGPLLAVIEAAGVTEDVEITGFVDDARIAAHHTRMRVFALSSDHEGLPNAILEAAASGLPIFATAVDGVKDVFTDGTDVLLVEPGDEVGLARALERVLADASLAASLSRQARLTAVRLSATAEVDRYLAIYTSLMGRAATWSTTAVASWA